MINWEFKSLVLDSHRKPALVSLSDARLANVRHYRSALQVALGSTVANPIFSNYFVKESVMMRSGEGLIMLPAGNIEYGLCQALHGEESAVAAFRSRFGRNKGDGMVLGIVAGNPGNIPSPCGNCRDIMLDDFGRDFEIVSGSPEGGVAVVAKMSDFLFDNPKPLFCFQEGPALGALTNGLRLENDAYSPRDKHPGRRYYASIISQEGRYYYGAHDVMCEYHPIYALRDAVRQARRDRDPFIFGVTIVCADYGDGTRAGSLPPQVMYKDRQHLLELNIQGELLSGKERDPMVQLLTYDAAKFRETGEFEPVGLWKTSVKEWLPLAFSPRNFGPEFVEYLTNYYKSLGPQ